MLADSPQDVRSGRLGQDVHLPAASKLELVSFIARQLPLWRDDVVRPKADAETVLTQQLGEYLTSAARRSEDWSHVQFRTETSDEKFAARKIDLTVKPCGVTLIIDQRRYSYYEALFPIECKRLPTPDTNGRDEREYVITEPGTTGGIQRFKFGHHGSTHAFAAMIGYVQEHTPSHWLRRVNGWIHDLTVKVGSEWTDLDALEILTDDASSRCCTLVSHHARGQGLVACELRHLWIQMN